MFQVMTLKSGFVSYVEQRGHFIAQRGHYLTPSTKSAPLWLRLHFDLTPSSDIILLCLRDTKIIKTVSVCLWAGTLKVKGKMKVWHALG